MNGYNFTERVRRGGATVARYFDDRSEAVEFLQQ